MVTMYTPVDHWTSEKVQDLFLFIAEVIDWHFRCIRIKSTIMIGLLYTFKNLEDPIIELHSVLICYKVSICVSRIIPVTDLDR